MCISVQTPYRKDSVQIHAQDSENGFCVDHIMIIIDVDIAAAIFRCMDEILYILFCQLHFVFGHKNHPFSNDPRVTFRMIPDSAVRVKPQTLKSPYVDFIL